MPIFTFLSHIRRPHGISLRVLERRLYKRFLPQTWFIYRLYRWRRLTIAEHWMTQFHQDARHARQQPPAKRYAWMARFAYPCYLSPITACGGEKAITSNDVYYCFNNSQPLTLGQSQWVGSNTAFFASNQNGKTPRFFFNMTSCKHKSILVVDFVSSSTKLSQWRWLKTMLKVLICGIFIPDNINQVLN